jgi:hypothetical protein
MIDRFSIAKDTWTSGFQVHVSLNPLKDPDIQLQRRYLHFRANEDKGSPSELRKIIDYNSSLRINFGWSFESSFMYESMMKECLSIIIPKFNVSTGKLISDSTCSWLGFLPFNVFERTAFEHLSVYGLILFNNEMINFQKSVIQSILNHRIYKQHALLRDNRYRFDLFKQSRKDSLELSDKYRQYMDAILEISSMTSVPRDLIEEDIGVHFLYDPNLFFELLSFSILKGEVYE